MPYRRAVLLVYASHRMQLHCLWPAHNETAIPAENKTDLFVLCAYILKLQQVLQLAPVYEQTAKIYGAVILLSITCVKSYIKKLSPL